MGADVGRDAVTEGTECDDRRGEVLVPRGADTSERGEVPSTGA